jgi:hypothetical protein
MLRQKAVLHFYLFTVFLDSAVYVIVLVKVLTEVNKIVEPWKHIIITARAKVSRTGNNPLRDELHVMRANRIQLQFRKSSRQRFGSFNVPFKTMHEHQKHYSSQSTPEAAAVMWTQGSSIPSNSTQIFLINFNLSSIA